MSTIPERINKLKHEIPPHVSLVAVSKGHSVESILEAHLAGQIIFGENKVQELMLKQAALPKEIAWHFIGHLQTNKVKLIAPFISLIHGVESFKLMEVINTEAQKNKRVIDCLLQVHLAEEITKFGFLPEEIESIFDDYDLHTQFPNIRICGLMGMATYTKSTAQIREEFSTLKKSFDSIKEKHFLRAAHFKTISMGMSSDYPLAVEEGSTMIRVGSAIFGSKISKSDH